jgi:DNA-binding FrmR family transcriptional regulator
MTHKPDHRIVTRLSRIEGQVRGIARMIEEERYCIDILTQLSAVKAALQRVEAEILKDHTAHCVAEAIRSGNAKDQKKKFDELVELFNRHGR